jgi:hypothetical protein
MDSQNQRGIMQFLCFSAIGVLYQAVSLAAFMFIAQTDFADEGKPLVVGAAILVSAVLVWIWIRSIKSAIWIFLVPVALAVGYSVAYYLVGLLFFPRLLGDFHPPYLDVGLSVLRVTGNVLMLFGMGTGLLVLLNRAAMWAGLLRSV